MSHHSQGSSYRDLAEIFGAVILFLLGLLIAGAVWEWWSAL